MTCLLTHNILLCPLLRLSGILSISDHSKQLTDWLQIKTAKECCHIHVR